MTPVLNQNIDTYKTLVEKSLVHREIAIRVMNQLKQEGKINGKVPLSGADLDMLNAGLMDHLSLRENLYEVAYAQSCWFEASEKTYQQLKMEPIITQVMIIKRQACFKLMVPPRGTISLVHTVFFNLERYC